MSKPWTCPACGTVNMAVYARCIACGTGRQGETPAPVPAPESSSGPDEDELHDSALRQTVVEAPAQAPRPKGDTPPPPGKKRPAVSVTQPQTEAGGGTTLDPAADHVRFTVRLLLPEGDRRTAEITERPTLLGSGMDQLGLMGDPRISSAEAKLVVDGGKLVVEPLDAAQGVYRRLREEEYLSDGDVVLMGDIAATFQHLKPGDPVDGAKQVLGGSANAPCGRLTFLRRDGSDGPIHDLPAGKTILGRTDGHLNFPHDSRLSRRHVRFFASEQGVTIEDLESRNGSYLRVRARRVLEVGDALRVGSAGLQVRGRN